MRSNAPGAPHNVRLRQAQGMVAVQLDCSMIEALAIMQNTAEATDETLDFIAAMVLDRRVQFD